MKKPSQLDLGIDLGTSQTRLVTPDGGTLLDECSVLAVQSGKNVAVGTRAQQMEERSGGAVKFYRPITEGVVCDTRKAGEMLRLFLRQAKVRRFPFLRVLAAVPASVSQVQRDALKSALRQAGASKVELVAAPLAVGHAAKLPLTENRAHLVLVLGEGITDIAALNRGEVIVARSTRTATLALDEALRQYVFRWHQLKISRATAKRLRLSAGTAFPINEETAQVCSGLDAVSPTPRELQITSEEIREAYSEPLNKILWKLREVIDEAGPEIATDLVETGITLAGGGAALPGMTELIHEQTGLKVHLVEEPAQAVAKGLQTILKNRREEKSRSK